MEIVEERKVSTGGKSIKIIIDCKQNIGMKFLKDIVKEHNCDEIIIEFKRRVYEVKRIVDFTVEEK